LLALDWKTGMPDFSRNMKPKPVKMYQKTQKVPNGHTTSQMCIKYTNGHKNINIFQSNALQNLPKIEIFGWKINHLATLLENGSSLTFFAKEPLLFPCEKFTSFKSTHKP
jgi:hypothetical protein